MFWVRAGAFGAAQAALQRIQMGARHHHVIGGAGGQAAHFLGDLGVQVALLFLRSPASWDAAGRICCWGRLPAPASVACWVRSCTISGEETIWATSAGLPDATSWLMRSLMACFSASSERACTTWALMPTICWSTMELPGAESLRLCSAL